MIAMSQSCPILIIRPDLPCFHRHIPPQVPLGHHRQSASTELRVSCHLGYPECQNTPSNRYMPCKRLRPRPARVRSRCTFDRHHMMFKCLCIYYNMYPNRCIQFLYINDIHDYYPNTNQLSMLNRTSHLLLIHKVHHKYYIRFRKRSKGNFEGIKCRNLL